MHVSEGLFGLVPPATDGGFVVYAVDVGGDAFAEFEGAQDKVPSRCSWRVQGAVWHSGVDPFPFRAESGELLDIGQPHLACTRVGCVCAQPTATLT